jgi:hypothetical protein
MTASGWRDMSKNDFRPTISVDFDGVIFPYSRGWRDGELYETAATPGFWPWLQLVTERFKVVVHSSRFAEDGAAELARGWLRACHETAGSPCGAALAAVRFSATKPPAWLTIDDRCLRFDGDWTAEELQPDALLAFKPWTQRNRL